MRPRDLILVLVSLVGLVSGVMWPSQAGFFAPGLLYSMMTILFLSFLDLDLGSLLHLEASNLMQVAGWGVVKLILLPLVAWALALWLAPSQALAVLVLAGVSTGVTAPFFAGMLGAGVNRVLQLTVLTSLLVPLTLPALLKLLMGAETRIDYWPMARMLLLIIFVPLIISQFTRRLSPRLAGALQKARFVIILMLFFTINLGVASLYADFLRDHPGQVLAAVVISFFICGASLALGWLAGRFSAGRLSGLDGAVALVYANNVLGIVFSAQFFGASHPEAPVLCTAYMLPLYLALLPMRALFTPGPSGAVSGGRA